MFMSTDEILVFYPIHWRRLSNFGYAQIPFGPELSASIFLTMNICDPPFVQSIAEDAVYTFSFLFFLSEYYKSRSKTCNF